MAEYARREGISRAAILKAVEAGRLETNGRTGRDRRVRGALAPSLKRTRETEGRLDARSELEKARIKKLKIDAKLSAQKLAEVRAALRLDTAEMILTEFKRAFAPLKLRLIELRLDADQAANFARIVEACIADFEAGARQKLKEYDAENETEN